MMALWWTIGPIGYLLIAVAASVAMYRGTEHGEYDRDADAVICMALSLIWPALIAVAPVVALALGWHGLIRLPDQRQERAKKTATNIRVLESEIYRRDDAMREYEAMRREDLLRRQRERGDGPWE